MTTRKRWLIQEDVNLLHYLKQKDFDLIPRYREFSESIESIALPFSKAHPERTLLAYVSRINMYRLLTTERIEDSYKNDKTLYLCANFFQKGIREYPKKLTERTKQTVKVTHSTHSVIPAIPTPVVATDNNTPKNINKLQISLNNFISKTFDVKSEEQTIELKDNKIIIRSVFSLV